MKPRKVLLVMVFVYIAFFASYSVLRFYVFENIYAPGVLLADTHIFYESLLNTVRGKGFFYNPYEGVYYPGVTSHFAVHNSPILFLLLPIIALFPYIETILITHAFFIGFGAITLFYFANEVLRDEKKALLISLMYLLNPFIHGINKADFHACALGIPFMFLVSYYHERREYLKMFISAFLVLSVREDAGLFLISLSLLYVLKRYEGLDGLFRESRREIILFIMGSLWIVLSYLIILYFNNWRGIPYGGYYEWVLNGGKPLLFTYKGLKFVLFVLSTFVFIPVLNRMFLASFPLWAQLLLANSTCWKLVTFDFHYPYMLIPFMFILLVYVIGEKGIDYRIIKVAFVVEFILSLLLSPVFGLWVWFYMRGKDNLYFWVSLLWQ